MTNCYADPATCFTKCPHPTACSPTYPQGFCDGSAQCLGGVCTQVTMDAGDVFTNDVKLGNTCRDGYNHCQPGATRYCVSHGSSQWEFCGSGSASLCPNGQNFCGGVAAAYNSFGSNEILWPDSIGHYGTFSGGSGEVPVASACRHESGFTIVPFPGQHNYMVNPNDQTLPMGWSIKPGECSN